MDIDYTPVNETIYNDMFEDSEGSRVFLLSPSKANAVWESYIDPVATSYFSLPDDNWVIHNEQLKSTDWIEFYNSGNSKGFADIIQNSVNWAEDTEVFYFAKKSIVFSSSWKVFLNCWHGFLASEDDCPLLMPKKGREALMFRPIGDVIKITRDSVGS